MKVVFDEDALDDLQNIFAWIAKDNPSAAASLVRRIFDKTERLANSQLSYMGRKGRDAGTHELLEGPYIIVYEVFKRRKLVRILSIVHGARER